jgi:hypothetical protein
MSGDSLYLLHNYLANTLTNKIKSLASSQELSSNLSSLAISVISQSPDNSIELNLQLFNQLETSSGLEFFTKYLRSFVAGNVLQQLYTKPEFGMTEFTDAMKMLSSFRDSNAVDRYDLMSKMANRLMSSVFHLSDLEVVELWLAQVEDLRFYEFIGCFIDDIQRTLQHKVFDISLLEVLRSPESRLACVGTLQRFKRFLVIADSIQDLQVLLLNSIIPVIPTEAVSCIRAIGLEDKFEELIALAPDEEASQDNFQDAIGETEFFSPPETCSLISSHEDFKVLNTLMVKGRDDEICVRILKVKLKKFLIENTDVVCIKTFTTPNFALIQKAQAEAKSIERALALPTPQICKAYDCYLEHLQEQGLYCFGIVMEWFEAGDLETEIKQRASQFKPWQEFELMQIFSDLIAALKVLEAHKICHSDIKPHNIFKADDLVYKIGDFGVAKEQIYSTVTATQTIAGTDVYFSPQCAIAFDSMKSQSRIRARYDIFKSDVFSLGLTFLRMSLISALPRRCSVFEVNKKISISGLNRMSQIGIDAKIDEVNYSDFLKLFLKAMLQVDERRRPRFSDLTQMITDSQMSFATIDGGKIGSFLNA